MKDQSTPERTPKHQKSLKKSLNSVCLIPVFDNSTSESPTESFKISSFTNVSEDYQLTESSESSTTSLSPVISSSSEAPLSSGITQFSTPNSDLSVNRCGPLQSDAKEAGSFEADLVAQHLRESMVPILNLDGMDSQHKKLLNALMNIVIEEFYRMPQERDRVAELTSRKHKFMFVSFILWLIAVTLLFFISTGAQRSFNGPPPT